MQKSVLVEIIRSLNKKEVREIQKWLQSPAHNQRQDVVRLFEYLVKTASGNQEELLAKTAIWPGLFPGEAFDDARIRQTMYFLLKSTEEYLAFTELSKDTVHIQTVLLKVYRNRLLERPFRHMMEAARKRQQTSPYRNSIFLREQHILEQELYFYLGTRKRDLDINLQETTDALDLAYIADKLQIACRMLAHKSVNKQANYNMGLLEPTLEYVEEQGLLKEPAVAVYYYGFKALTEKESDPFFTELEKCIFEHGHLFPLAELREIYLLAINYCVGRFNSGETDYAKRAFDLFRKGFEDNILLENNLISRFTFGNAIAFALRLKEYDWVEKFIQQFQHNLEEKYRRSVVHFNQSRLYFEKGDYDMAQRLLIQFEYDDMLLNIIAKTMLLKIYYEQGEFDAFESLLESMRIYLQRKEALDTHRKTAYKNLISIMKKLLHLNPYSKTQTERLRALVVETNPLMERDWLLRQLDGRR